MKTIQEFMDDEIQAAMNSVEGALKRIQVLTPLALIPADWVTCWAWPVMSYITIGLNDAHAEAAPGVVKSVLKALGAHRANKVFVPETGRMKYVIESGNLTVVVECAPTRCKVKVVEQEVEVPAHVEKKKMYVLDNPEECLGKEDAA